MARKSGKCGLNNAEVRRRQKQRERQFFHQNRVKQEGEAAARRSTQEDALVRGRAVQRNDPRTVRFVSAWWGHQNPPVVGAEFDVITAREVIRVHHYYVHLNNAHPESSPRSELQPHVSSRKSSSDAVEHAEVSTQSHPDRQEPETAVSPTAPRSVEICLAPAARFTEIAKAWLGPEAYRLYIEPAIADMYLEHYRHLKNGDEKAAKRALFRCYVRLAWPFVRALCKTLVGFFIAAGN